MGKSLTNEEFLERVKKHDKIKYDYANSHGFNLYYLTYKDDTYSVIFSKLKDLCK